MMCLILMYIAFVTRAFLILGCFLVSKSVALKDSKKDLESNDTQLLYQQLYWHNVNYTLYRNLNHGVTQGTKCTIYTQNWMRFKYPNLCNCQEASRSMCWWNRLSIFQQQDRKRSKLKLRVLNGALKLEYLLNFLSGLIMLCRENVYLFDAIFLDKQSIKSAVI